jgi:type II secretory pathway component PulK
MAKQPAAPVLPRRSRLFSRRGSVLVTVLVVVVLLALASYQYTDVMTSQYKHSTNIVRYNQARMACESGVNYVCALLGEPSNISGMLNGNPYYNPEYYQDQLLMQDKDNRPRFNSKFSVIAPGTMPGDIAGAQGPLFGVCDEAGKINVNAVMRLDPTGKTLYNLLMQLPNMTDDIACAIVDWLDADDVPYTSPVGGQGGAETSYYMGMSPPYAPKSGPIDSLEELLLVRGVTPDLLYGNDINKNGVQDPNEGASDGSFSTGWSAYLTIYSREQNINSSGSYRVYVNDPSLTTLQTNLQGTQLSADLQTFILLYRIYGSSGTATTTTTSTTSAANANVTMATGMGGAAASINIATATAKSTLSSLYTLINATVDVPGTNGGKSTRYTSPLAASATSGSEDMTNLLDQCTIYQYTEIQGRINVNTASPAVIQALMGVATSLTTTDIQNIIMNQPQFLSNNASMDPSYGSPSWLITKAGLTVAKMQSLEKYVTTTTEVYSFNVLGYFDEGGPVVRYEAVVDMNYINSGGVIMGQPRILHQRDISELGMGWDPHGSYWTGGGGGQQ